MAFLLGIRILKNKLPNLFLNKNFSSSHVYRGFTGYKTRDKLYSRQAAQDFIFRLNQRERSVLLDELQRFRTQAEAIKAESEEMEPPSSSQLRAVAAHNAMPFIGFGFLDNCIMIIAGDYIDTTLGVTLGISTMAAAGLGNALSDVAGIGSAHYVESFAIKIGVKAPLLTPVQNNMARTRLCINLGRAVGVVIGCVLGMFPLLFLPPKESVIEAKK